MHEERRDARRARVPGVRVTFETAAGQRIEAAVHDIGTGGVFICTEERASIGKRLSLEFRLSEGMTWSALGRVVWLRKSGTAAGPPGMGVKLIDIEESALEAVERLVAAREGTVGAAPFSRVPGANHPAAPAREATLVGVAPPGSEPSVPLGLVVKKPERPIPASETPKRSHEPERARRRRRWPGLLLLVAAALIAAAAAAYALRDRIPWVRVRSMFGEAPSFPTLPR
jgi:uncharacterized protein (TIGR02266 family)